MISWSVESQQTSRQSVLCFKSALPLFTKQMWRRRNRSISSTGKTMNLNFDACVSSPKIRDVWGQISCPITKTIESDSDEIILGTRCGQCWYFFYSVAVLYEKETMIFMWPTIIDEDQIRKNDSSLLHILVVSFSMSSSDVVYNYSQAPRCQTDNFHKDDSSWWVFPKTRSGGQRLILQWLQEMFLIKIFMFASPAVHAPQSYLSSAAHFHVKEDQGCW